MSCLCNLRTTRHRCRKINMEMRLFSNNNRLPDFSHSLSLSLPTSHSSYSLTFPVERKSSRLFRPPGRDTREPPDKRRDIKQRVYLFKQSVINHVRPAALISSPFPPRSFLRFPGACFWFVSLNAPALYALVSTLVSSVPPFQPSLSFSLSLPHPSVLRLLARTSVRGSFSSLQIFSPHPLLPRPVSSRKL